MNVQKNLVDDYSVSEDGLVWTLKLRDGVLFQSGNPMDAEAVKAQEEAAKAAKAQEQLEKALPVIAEARALKTKMEAAMPNLKEKKEDILIAAEDQAAKLKELEGCEIYSIEQEKGVYTVSIDTEDHTFMIKVSGSADAEEWDRFLSKD